ncbi:hypothetical protein HY641_00790 [Candidatus Woesearchaeota archaeon]|nr:hypothetical protein [Candidatus Woesearchaeota archaeon]
MSFTRYALIILIISIAAYAHEEEKGNLHIRGFDIALQEDQLLAGTNTPLTVTIHEQEGPAQGLLVQGQILDRVKGKEIYYAAVTEAEPGTYTFTWEPSFAGTYYLQYIFRSHDTIIQPTFEITVTDPREAYWLWGSVALGIIALLLGFYASREKKRFNYKTMGIATLIAIALAGLGYSVSTFYAAGGEAGFVVCGAEGCELAVHWHSNVEITVCSEGFDLPLEAGNLDKVHTHKEKGRLHFHSLIKTDTEGVKLLEPEKLRVGQLFDHIGMRFTSTCIGTYCNGDACPDGTVGNLRMTLNGAPHPDLSSYSYKDGDKMNVVFG